MKSKNTKDTAVAVEKFIPELSLEYRERFKGIIKKIGKSLPINRYEILNEELQSLQVDVINECEEIELLKYAVSLSVLKDLSQQGWCFEVCEDELSLKMEEENLDDKAYIRYRLSAERNAQFKVESIKKFIKRMEEKDI